MLRNKNLLKLFSGTIISSFAQHMSFVITGSLAYQLTKSEFFSSIAWAGNALAQIIAFPISILITDTKPKNLNLFFSYIIGALTAILFAILIYTNVVNIWLVIFYIVILSSAQFVGDTSGMSLVPFIVPKIQTQTTFSLIGLAYFFSSTLGPLATGQIVASFGNASSILLKSTLLICAALIYRSLKIENSDLKNNKKSIVDSIKSGYILITKNQNVLNLFFIHWLIYMLAVPGIHGLLPVHADEKFGLGVQGVGYLFTVIGMGGVSSTMLLTILGDKIKNKTKLIALNTLSAGICMILFAHNDSQIISLTFLFLFSFSIINILTLRLGLLGELMPKNDLGKVFSINFLSSSTSIIGSSFIGIVSNSFGAVFGTTISGAIIIILLLFMIILLKSFRANVLGHQ